MRRTFRNLCTAVIVAGAALLSTSCSEEAERTDSFADRYGTVTRGIALPVAVPPRIESAGLVNANGVQTASFYSTNEPIVHVCSGDRATCSKSHAFTEVLRSEKVEGADVTMFLLPNETEDGTPQLPADLRKFWTEVALTGGRPEWVDKY